MKTWLKLFVKTLIFLILVTPSVLLGFLMMPFEGGEFNLVRLLKEALL